MQVVFLDRATFAPDIIFAAENLPSCTWREFTTTAPGDIAGRAKGAAVIVTNKVRLGDVDFARLPELRLVAVAATGTDNVDLKAAARRGLAVCNVRGYAVETVPEHVFAVLLALRRNLASYRAAAVDGAWARSPVYCLHDFPIFDLAGSTLGVVGRGTLGRAVGRLGEAFGMRVLFAERRPAGETREGYTPFIEVLGESDVVSLHVPLTPETKNMIGAAELARMKPTAILINAARGGVVDEAALLAALCEGRIGGAAVDVLSSEPPPADHPLLTAGLSNLIVTPHIAWASRQAQQRLADEVIANIAAFQRGEARNRVA